MSRRPKQLSDTIIIPTAFASNVRGKLEEFISEDEKSGYAAEQETAIRREILNNATVIDIQKKFKISSSYVYAMRRRFFESVIKYFFFDALDIFNDDDLRSIEIHVRRNASIDEKKKAVEKNIKELVSEFFE